MSKKYFYDFSGRVFVEAENQDKAEELITGISLDYFLIDEDVYQIDAEYVPTDMNQREQLFGSTHHPLENAIEFDEFKKRKAKYDGIFQDFYNGRINKNELIEYLDKDLSADDESDDYNPCAEVEMVDLKTKKSKTVKLIAVD
jgi:hypothetical protein